MKVSKQILFYRLTEDKVLFISTLTGAVDIVDAELYETLKEGNLSEILKIDESTLNSLKERGYLFDDSSKEESIVNYVIAANKKASRKLSFIVCPTYSCNLRCIYCFEGNLTQSSADMDSEDIFHLFSAIDELCRTFPDRNPTIELFGGEPFLPKTKEFVKELFYQARERSIEVGVVSNGTFLDQYVDILQVNKDIVAAVQVTLDGPKGLHDIRRKSASEKGSFDRVCLAIDTILDLGIKTQVRVNVDRQNIDSIPELYDLMVERGWTKDPNFTCALSPVQDHTFKKGYSYLMSEDQLVGKVFEIFRQKPYLKDVFQLNMFRALRHIRAVVGSNKSAKPQLYYCEANNLEGIVFGPDGLIYTCTECMGNKDLAIGKFRPRLELYSNAVEMWNHRNVLSVEKCKSCDIAFLCGGGCAYSAIAVNGDINKPVCNSAKETIFAYLDFVKEELINKI